MTNAATSSIDADGARDWYERARVRRAAAPDAVPARTAAMAFAPELCPYLWHPHVVALGAGGASALLERARTRYLHGTSVLEVRVVNEVAADLAHGRTIELAPADRVAALQLYCDEGFHAVVASDLLARGGVDEADEAPPAFLGALAALVAERGTDDGARVVRFLFAVVTETSISQSLASLSRSSVIDPVLRTYVDDHARDEARHAAFFSWLFARFWTTASARERASLAPLLPRIVEAFLGPPLAAIEADLALVGLDAAARCEVLVASRPALESLGRRGARPVLACFARGGVDVDRLFPREV